MENETSKEDAEVDKLLADAIRIMEGRLPVVHAAIGTNQHVRNAVTCMSMARQWLQQARDESVSGQRQVSESVKRQVLVYNVMHLDYDGY